MDIYRASVLLHLLCSILLVGQALYWMIMLSSLNRQFAEPVAQRLLLSANAARWPHVIVPYAWRLPLPWVTWITLAILMATGFAAMIDRGTPGGPLWSLKLALLAAIVALQVPLTRRPSAVLIRVNFILVLAIIVVSGWTTR
jgi:hypothetical protein